MECAKYFLSRAQAVLQPGYVPNDQDILQCRAKTTGIVEHDFTLKTRSGHEEKKLILVSYFF